MFLRHAAFALLFAFLPILVSGADSTAENVYSPGGWATLHRSPANRRLVPGVFLGGLEYPVERVWTALEGASVLTAPTSSPDGRTLYVTTGRAAGHANLHAFDLSGRRLWRSMPWQDAGTGLDPCAVLSSVIVDRDGDLYIGDCNQLFSFRDDGSEKWVVPLPPRRAGDWKASESLPVNALTTAVFTRGGHLLGVTNFADVIVVDRKTGRSLAAPMRLPGRVPERSTRLAMPGSVFSNGLLDPEIREWAWELLVGGAMPSANTPAVDLVSGRVFVTASSTRPGRGVLYALDLTESEDRVGIEIAFATEMGPGSGSSPVLSLSGDRVYVSDEQGVFYAIDAGTGTIVWQVQTKATAAAAAVGANGDIYALQASGPAVVAMTREGRIRWESDLHSLAERALPSSWLLGDPVAIGNGNPTVVADAVLVPVVYGYETHLGRRIPWPVISSLVALDLETGRGMRDVVGLADDSTGVTAVLPDGTLVNSLGTALTSGAAPLAGVAGWLLPGGRELLLPRGGIQVSRPREAPTGALPAD